MIAASPRARQPQPLADATPQPAAGSARRRTRSAHNAVLESAALARIREAFLNEPNAVPLIVLGPTRDPVEAINSLLRRAG